MPRLRLPQLIKSDDDFEVTTKTDDDKLGGRQESTKRKGFKISAHINWPDYYKKFSGIKKRTSFSFYRPACCRQMPAQ